MNEKTKMGKQKEMLIIIDDVTNAMQAMSKAAVEMSKNATIIAEALQDLKGLVTSTPASELKSTPKKENEEGSKTYTLEEVRAVLAEKSTQGYSKQIKEMLTEYGADKLSTLKPEFYGDIMKKGKALGND